MLIGKKWRRTKFSFFFLPSLNYFLLSTFRHFHILSFDIFFRRFVPEPFGIESKLHGKNVEGQNVEEQTIEGTKSRNTKCRKQIQLNKAKYRSDETSKRLNAEKTKFLEEKEFASSIPFVQNFTFFRNFEQRIFPSLKILNGPEWTITQKNAEDRRKSLF